MTKRLLRIAEGVDGWIGAGPLTAWAAIQIAVQPVGAAVSQNAIQAVGDEIGWMDDFGF